MWGENSQSPATKRRCGVKIPRIARRRPSHTHVRRPSHTPRPACPSRPTRPRRTPHPPQRPSRPPHHVLHVLHVLRTLHVRSFTSFTSSTSSTSSAHSTSRPSRPPRPPRTPRHVPDVPYVLHVTSFTLCHSNQMFQQWNKKHIDVSIFKNPKEVTSNKAYHGVGKLQIGCATPNVKFYKEGDPTIKMDGLLIGKCDLNGAKCAVRASSVCSKDFMNPFWVIPTSSDKDQCNCALVLPGTGKVNKHKLTKDSCPAELLPSINCDMSS